MAYTIRNKVRSDRSLSRIEIAQGEAILDIVADQASGLFFDIEKFFDEDDAAKAGEQIITLDLVKEIVKWDKKHKRLKPFEYRFMSELAEEKKSLTGKNKYIASLNFKKVKKYGFPDFTS